MDNFIRRIGNGLTYGGFILSNGIECYLIPLPEEFENINDNAKSVGIEDIVIDTRGDIWDKIIRQTDLVEVEIFDQNEQKKIIVRKTQRQMDAKIQWQCFKRDGYKCRYCGIDDVPLTVDHVMTWENGGPTYPENLVTCCRKCNKTRGNMPYEQWLESDYYKQISSVLTEAEKLANFQLTKDLSSGKIRPMANRRKR